MVTKQRDRDTISTQQPGSAPGNVKIMTGPHTTGGIVLTIGIMEIIYGILATFSSAFGAIAFVWLLSGAVLISGTLGLATTIGRGDWARFAAAIISAAAGFIGLAHPVIGFSFFGLLMGLYLVGTGVARLFSFEQPVLTRIFGVIAILFSIWVFFGVPTVNAVLLGILVGINIIFQGILSAINGSGTLST